MRGKRIIPAEEHVQKIQAAGADALFEELAALGIQLIVCPLTALYASAQAITEILIHRRKAGTTRDLLNQLLPFEQFHRILDLDAHYQRGNASMRLFYAFEGSPQQAGELAA